MKQIMNVFIQDLKNIKRVPLMGLLLIGLAFLPSLYAWFNLSASWDPYSNTSEITIAVVNEDNGATIEGKDINVGNELVANLMENDALGWIFVNKQDAMNGVYYGDYFASIYINETFSEDLSQVIYGNPQSAEIHYQVNEKLNAIAPKMTSAGATSIVTEITESFIEAASKALFTEFNKIGLRLEEELPTIRRLEQAVFDIEARFPDIDAFGEAIIDLHDDWGEIEQKADQFLSLREYIPKIHEGTDRILALEERLPELHEAGEKIIALEEAMPKVEEAVDELERVGSRFGDVKDQLDQAMKEIVRAQSVIDRAKGALPAIEETAQSTEEYVKALALFVDEAKGAADPILQLIWQEVVYIEQTAATIDDALAQLERAESPQKALDILRNVHPRLQSSSDMLHNAIQLFSVLNKILPSSPLQPTIDRLTHLKERVDSLKEGVETIIRAGETAGAAIPEVRQKAQETKRVAAEVNAFFQRGGADRITDALGSIHDKAWQASETVKEAQRYLPSVEQMLNNAEKMTVISEDRLNQLIDSLPKMERRIDGLIQRVKHELPTVIALIERASSFVKHDLPIIDEKVKEVADLIRNDLGKVEDEYMRLADILEEQLPHVEQALGDMAQFARARLPELEDKIGKAADRMRQFESEHNVGELISLLKNDIEEESAFFAKPVQLKEERLFAIPNYGSANAPFYTALSLWVGALLLSNLLSTNVHPIDMRKEYSLLHVYFGRMILFLIIGILQALIISTGNLYLLKAYTANPFLFVVFTVLIAIVFMTIVYTFASVFGNIGKALAVVLMVLQLSGAGGTFPIQVAPPFFQAVHPFLPFTYAINLLREAVGGTIPVIAWKQIGMLVLFWALAIGLGIILKKPLAKRMEQTAEKSKASRLME